MKKFVFLLFVFLVVPHKASIYPYVAPVVNECRVTLFVNDVTEIDIVTSILYAESAGEYHPQDDSQKAILDVVSNRMASPKFPNSPLGVLLQKGQFDGKWVKGFKHKDSVRYNHLKCVVEEWYASCHPISVLDFGYCYYYNPRTSTDTTFVSWANTRSGMVIKSHRFFK